MKKANTSTYYTFGELNYNGVSADRFDTIEEAINNCIECMRERHKKGYPVTDMAIIRLDYVTINDELMRIMEQTTRTTVETISKHYVERGTDEL